MASMPQTPSGGDARGRSRFSKVLPLPPNANGNAPTISPLYSPLPQTPKFALPPLPKAIPRKAIGMTTDQRALSAALARATNSPMYSQFPAIQKPSTPAPTSLSDDSSSAMGSFSGRESNATTPPMSTPPTLPPKDNQIPHSQRKQTRTPSPIPAPEVTIAALQNSPQELWKRRSVKSDRSLHFDTLQLDRSNGSTASPPRQEAPPSKVKGPLPSLPRSNTQPPPRKPVPAPAPPTEVPMGAKISKLKDKASTSRSTFQNSSSDSRQDERPPTPEYNVAPSNPSHNYNYNGVPTNGEERGRARKPVQNSHHNLQSPHTPPSEENSLPHPPTIPVRADSRSALSLLTNLLNENDSQSTLQAPKHSHSRETSSETITVRSPQPKIPDVSHILPVSPRDTTPIELPSNPLPDPPVSANSTSSESDARRGRSRQSLSTSHFPVLSPSTIHPADTMLPGLPLTNIQFDCYQNHKFMRSTRNNICPVACMLCEGGEADIRWRCTWCCLSCCAACMQVLVREEVGKDLRVAVGIVRGGKAQGKERKSGMMDGSMDSVEVRV